MANGDVRFVESTYMLIVNGKVNATFGHADYLFDELTLVGAPKGRVAVVMIPLNGDPDDVHQKDLGSSDEFIAAHRKTFRD